MSLSLHGCQVSWTTEGLEAVFVYVIERGKTGATHVEVFESGLPWTDGIKTYSTGINGTHHEFFGGSNLAQCKGDAKTLARRIVTMTQEFPSWRCLAVDAGPHGVSSISVHGGRYSRQNPPQ